MDSVGVAVDASGGVPEQYKRHIEQVDIFDLMKRYSVRHPDGTPDGLSEVVRASAEIESLKARLVPFLAYMDKRELNLYADLEEIFIFENMDSLDTFPPKQHLMTKEFPYIVAAFYDCQLIVKRVKNEFVSYESNT